MNSPLLPNDSLGSGQQQQPRQNERRQQNQARTAASAVPGHANSVMDPSSITIGSTWFKDSSTKRTSVLDGYVRLQRAVAQAVETSAVGQGLVLLDVALSLSSVILYIISTYVPNHVLGYVQFYLACVFTLNWSFWLWVAPDRVRYVLGSSTAIDAVTILPEFVLFGLATSTAVPATAETLPQLNFLRVLRILRVLRVLKMKRLMRRWAEGAVTEAATKLGVTLMCILLIAAGMFYELEKYGPPRDVDLSFLDAVYWAAVTITTVGYGDFAPSYWATQLMLVALLVMTFTLLPYLTSGLLDALMSTSSYQRKWYKQGRRSGVRHIVVMGAVDGTTLQGLLDELYHTDKGYSRDKTVVLADNPPDQEVKHVLYTHDAANKVVFLQGSAFSKQDLDRAAVASADAVLIIAPKYAPQPALADRCACMMTLAVGQHLHTQWSALQKQSRNLAAPLHFPAVFVQMCQPEGRMALRRVLTSLQPHNSLPASFGTAAAGGPDSCANSTAPSSAQQRSVARVHAQDPLAGDTHRDKGFWQTPVAHSKGSWAACSLDGLPSGALQDATSTGFWEVFAACVHVLCLSEVKCALVAQGVVGVPGVMSLLCNLSTTVNLKLDTDEAEQAANLPPWLLDYMAGASQELYQLDRFPSALVGCTVLEAAGFLFDACHAVLLAVEPTQGLQRHRMIVGDLKQVISPDMHGYLVAVNSRSVELMRDTQQQQFDFWRQMNQDHQQQYQPLTRLVQQPPSSSSPVGETTRTQPDTGSQPDRPAGKLHPGVTGVSSPLGALLHLLRSPSRALRQQGEEVLQQNYHLRPPGALQSPEELVVPQVDLSGHILVLGVPASQESLITLLAAGRSKQLQAWRPVVILDRTPPCQDSGFSGSWEAVAQFADVYFIQVTNGLSDALLRASAERAVQAVLMAPLTLQDESAADRLSEKVMTDAHVINVYQLLKSLNPGMEVSAEVMLPQNMSFMAPTPPACDTLSSRPHLLSPAYMSGSVFHARLLDDILVASYSNSNATTRILLELLLSWHTRWTQGFTHQQGSTLQQPQQQQPQQQLQQQLQTHAHTGSAQQHGQQEQLSDSPAGQQEQVAGGRPPDVEQGPDQAGGAAVAAGWTGAAAAGSEAQSLAAPAAAAAGGGGAGSVAAGLTGGRQQQAAPTLLQIPVNCAPGTTYGRYFHSLLLERGLLLLGVHRRVQQDGLCFRVTVTNPAQDFAVQPDDNAFVVARLQLPADPSDAAAVAAAWPPDTLGFGHLDAAAPGAQQQPDHQRLASQSSYGQLPGEADVRQLQQRPPSGSSSSSVMALKVPGLQGAIVHRRPPDA